ncbi:MAG: DnaJ domain-containing protein [Synergistaceae bacterium]|jgi:curved DNA-binding protein|nr:DnaJ domain-containing protein [Synergistaceae bacterium]
MGVEYKDYYGILGVERAASQDDIRKAYRKLAKKYHPDVSKDKNADARYREINEAYEVLKDSNKRSRYDTLGENWRQGQDFAPPSDWDAGGRVKYGGEWASFSDFFKTLFGGDFGFSEPARRDSQAELVISLEDAARGGLHTLTLRPPGQAARTIRVNLPKGVSEGARIRLRGKALGGGDLYVTLRLASHPTFEVDGHNLIRSVRVTPWLAALGGAVSVGTLDGDVEMKLPPGTQNGQKLRLRGKGLPKRDNEGSGDLYVRVEVAIPTRLTQRQKELWEELARLGE